MTIFLKKSKASDHWDCLEYKKPIVSDPNERKAPTNEKDPNAGLMDMMKEMYQNGDPEMKKIIAESFSKSQSGEGQGNKGKMPKMGGQPGMGGEGMGGMDMANMAKMFGGMGGQPGMGEEGMGDMDMSKMLENMGKLGKK